MERKAENQFEQRKETIEFYVANSGDYPGFQKMLRDLDPSCYEVRIVVGPSDKVLPAIVRKGITGPLGHVPGPREYSGKDYMQEALNVILQNSRYRAKKIAK